MRRQILNAVDMALYVVALIVDQARTSIQARRDDKPCARRWAPGSRGDRS